MQIHSFACLRYSQYLFFLMQLALPQGVMLLRTILSSDKTNISMMMGNRIAHLLISLTNIHMITQLKISSNSFILTILLPVPKFLHKNKCMCGMLGDHLVYQCLNITLEPLNLAACEGIMLLDPVGHFVYLQHSHYCFTPLTSFIINTPEAMMLAAIGGKTLPVTMAMFK
ncbi:hypothetical protein BDR06DRAFT_886051 [Suillus hirtellus]|nr:hypothetical protein BDR06DRAFT_886051 [Suillus hirtellus]